MEKQILIALSREYGSGGLYVAQKISEHFGIKLYDKDMLREIAEELHLNPKQLEKYDETPRKLLAGRRVGAYSNSIEDILTELEFRFLIGRAAAGESFAVVGRCGKSALCDEPGLISFFITGDEDDKSRRVMEYLDTDFLTAEKQRKKIDRQRLAYHNRYSDHDWGCGRSYDLCINSSRLGIDGTAQILIRYIKAFRDAAL